MKNVGFNRFLLLFLLPVLITSCGPIIGNIMVLGGGVKSIEVVSGNPSDFVVGRKVVVLAPFLKGDDGHYLSRGDDAANLLDAFETVGFLDGRLFFESDFGRLKEKSAEYKAMNPEALREAGRLDFLPEYLLVGTIQSRHTTVAPTKGVIMDVTYKLELVDLARQKSIVIDVRARDLYQFVPMAVAEAVFDLISGR